MIGAGSGVGVPHFCILTANYLTGVYRRKTAVLEWNSSGDFEKMEQVCTGRQSIKKPFSVMEVDYFKEAGMDELVVCLKQNYDHILIDFGVICSKNQHEFFRCDKHFILGSLSEWCQDEFLELLEREDFAVQGWIYCAIFGSDETRIQIKKERKLTISKIPISVDSFLITRDIITFYERFIQ